MKKSSIKKIFAAVIIIGLILVLAVLSPLKPDVVPHFNFIDTNAAYIRVVESETDKQRIRHIYSFKTDINKIQADIRDELTELDYFGVPISSMSAYRRKDVYLSKNEKLEGKMIVIYKNTKMMESSQIDSVSSISGAYGYHSEDGWISVEIMQTERSTNWLIYHINKLLDKLQN